MFLSFLLISAGISFHFVNLPSNEHTQIQLNPNGHCWEKTFFFLIKMTTAHRDAESIPFGCIHWASFHYELVSCMATTSFLRFYFQFVYKMLSLKHCKEAKLCKASLIDGRTYISCEGKQATQVNWREV